MNRVDDNLNTQLKKQQQLKQLISRFAIFKYQTWGETKRESYSLQNQKSMDSSRRCQVCGQFG